MLEKFGTRIWYRLLASLGGIGSSAPIVGSCLGWPRGRSGVERLRHGKRGVHIKYGIALIETIRVLYRRVGAENFEEALDELREALSTIVRLLFDYLDVDQLAEFLERMGR